MGAFAQGLSFRRISHAISIPGCARTRGNEFGDLYDSGHSEVQKLRSRLLLKNLIHPEGIWEKKFRSFIQQKGIDRRAINRLIWILTAGDFGFGSGFRSWIQAPVSSYAFFKDFSASA